MKMESMGPRKLTVIVALVAVTLAHPIPGHAVISEILPVSSPATRPVATTEVAGVHTSKGLPSGLMDRTDRLIVKYKNGSLAKAKTLDRGAVQSLSARAGMALTHLRAMSGNNHLFTLPKRMTPEEAQAIAQKLSADPSVEYAVPDRIMSPMLVPNDPNYPAQWHYQSPDWNQQIAGINLPQAWDITTGSNSLVIGVIDTGIVDHADLQGRVLPGYNFISDPVRAGNGVGRSADASDLGDWVTSAESSDPASVLYQCNPTGSTWHGTHVSGTIGATSNNGLGVTGINWNSKILPVRTLGKCGGYMSDVIDGMRWAAGLSVEGVPANSNPARILNMSLGGHGACNQAMQDAINDVVAAGTVIVVAAGNNNDYAAEYTPAGCTGVISVAAVNHAGGGTYYTNYGQSVTIAAPGGERNVFAGPAYLVLSTVNAGVTSPIPTPDGDSYRVYEGTSMAAPHVAGVASLMLSAQPNLTPAQVAGILQTTARPFASGTNSYAGDCDTFLCGAGMVDAYRAVDAVSSRVPLVGAAPSFLEFTIHPGEPAPPSQNIAITNVGAGTMNWRASSDAGWLQVSPSSGQGSGSLTISADTSSLYPGTNYTGTITISAGGDASASVTIPVRVKELFKLRAPLLFPVQDHAQAAVNGKVYVIGGVGGDVGIVQIYDTVSDAWTTGAPKPTATSATNAAVIDGKIYVPGGRNRQNAPIDALEIYDPATDQWSLGAPLPVPLQGLAVEAVGGKLYAVGGQDPQQSNSKATYVYDPNTDTWTGLADMPYAMSWPSSGVLNGRIYIFAVADFNGAEKLTEVFDPLTNSWSMAGALNISRFLAAGTGMAGKLYVSAGVRTGLQRWRQDFEVYDPGTDAWSLVPLWLNAPRDQHKISAVGNSIYVMGGAVLMPASGGLERSSTLNESYDVTTAGIGVTFAAGQNGTITGATSQTVNYGGSTTPVTAVPASGYHFVNWTGTHGFVATTNNPLTVGNVIEKLTITANFLADPLDGACGGSNGRYFASAPTDNLCATGTASALTCAGAWNWSCSGSNGGLTANCSAGLKGDVNGDGKVDIADAVEVLRIAVKLETATPDMVARGDVAPLNSPDGVIDIVDALILLKKVVGVVRW